MRTTALIWKVIPCLVCFLTASLVAAQTGPAPGTAANSHPVYQALRNVSLSGAPVTVRNLVLKRDAGTFVFESGTFCFATPIEGKVTAAVFQGSGTFTLNPPTEVERKSLARLTNEPRMAESFNELVLRFSDSTFEEIKSAASAGSGACPDLLKENMDAQRKRIKYNFTGRILQDVLSNEPGGFFAAFVKGNKYGGKLLYVIDPHGLGDILISVAPEEVMLANYAENKMGFWAAFHLASEYAGTIPSSTEKNGLIRIEKQQLDTTLEKSGRLAGKAITTFVTQKKVRVVPLDLFPKLRVERVTDASGQSLNFIQEDKDEDSDFSVILPRTLAAGERFSITTVYSGKGAVQNEGSGNYYPVARHDWYPNTGFQDYALYEMRFTLPKNLKLVATGTPVSEVIEGDQLISTWRSEGPQTVAGFLFGDLKKESKLVRGITLETYVNTSIPDVARQLQLRSAMPVLDPRTIAGDELNATGNMTTTVLSKKAMAEAEVATNIFTDYFGPTPFKRLAMTQQTAMNYGQSWPQLVWLPMSYFYDSTTRHALKMDDPRGYFKVVGPHEIAHQWWGHTVTWASYRDQWMSEGFAEQSASIFYQMVYSKNPEEYIKFWNDERDLLLERNKEGFRPIDVGPVTLGYRIMSQKTGFDIPRRLIYPKGAYIVHMIRMMMWNPKTGDQNFKALMHDFVQTYANRPASTEDFKAMVEKHITPLMDLDGNGKLNWFFDQYVYGTALPRFQLDYAFENDANGLVFKFKVEQSNVADNFRMMVPIYLELADGRVARLGQLFTQKNAQWQRVSLGTLKDKPKRAMLNYFNDVLCEK